MLKYVGRHFAKKSDYINAKMKAESRRSERVENAESAESLKDSADSIESAKDSNVLDCHEVVPTSRNDTSPLSVIARRLVAEAIHITKIFIETQNPQIDSNDSIKSSEKIDCHSRLKPLEFRNYGVKLFFLDCHENPCGLPRNDDSSFSVIANIRQNVKQSIKKNNPAESRRSERAESAESHTKFLKVSNDSIKSNDKMDCHEATPLAMTDMDASAESIKMDCHEFNKLNSRNDTSPLSVIARRLVAEAIHKNRKLFK